MLSLFIFECGAEECGASFQAVSVTYIAFGCLVDRCVFKRAQGSVDPIIHANIGKDNCSRAEITGGEA